MPKTTKILIVEDYAIVREGLKALVETYPYYKVVGEAADGKQAFKLAMALKPDLILMDLSLPNTNGMTAIKEIKEHLPETKILALTIHKTEGYVRRTLESGADGYILKESTYSELERAIRSVLEGKPYLSPDISGGIIQGYLQGLKSVTPGTLMGTLSPREIEILKLIAEGFKNKDISDYLGISIKTVDKHRTNLMKKLDLHSVSALTLAAVREGLVEK